jgi:hypothetical protein
MQISGLMTIKCFYTLNEGPDVNKNSLIRYRIGAKSKEDGMRRRSPCWLGLVLGLSLLFPFFLVSCQPQATDLTFETIEQKESPGTGNWYQSKDPGILVITQVADISAIDQLVTDAAITKLKTFDYDTGFALIVFQGQKPSTRYSIQIERIARSGDKVKVYVKLNEPTFELKVNDIITSPYQLVLVQKTGLWAKDITFEIVADGKNIASSDYKVP